MAGELMDQTWQRFDQADRERLLVRIKLIVQPCDPIAMAEDLKRPSEAFGDTVRRRVYKIRHEKLHNIRGK
ncbi:MAG: hypothetical protein WDM79_19355 [Terricaulis sp.]